MTLKTLFVPGPDDVLGPRLRGALGPNADLTMLDSWSPSDNVSELADRSEALVLGPGAEPAWELGAGDGDIRFVQFTGCRQSSLTVNELQADELIVANAGPAIAPFVTEQTMSLIQAALGLASPNHWALGKLTVGVVGLGNVGIEVARLLRNEGASIVYHDVRAAAQGYVNGVGIRRHSLDRLLLNSDVVTLHVGDTPHTGRMIGARELKLMKPGAVLINTSLSEAVGEEALLSSLATGKLGAVGLGVMETSPEGKHGPLSNHPRVIAKLEDATDREFVLKAVADLVADNLKRVESGNTPIGLMDPVGFPGAGDPAFWSSRLAPRRPA